MRVSVQHLFRSAVVAACLISLPWALRAQAQPAQEAHGEAAAGEHAASGEDHGEGLGALLARLANFAILAGGLWYLLRSPLGKYLDARSQEIRQGLKDAADMKANAARQMQEIDARMNALPGELEAMRARGAEEIAAEEARIRQLAETERQRLVEQAQREIDLRLQAARRDLTRHAADLAIGVASKRLQTDMTDADQQRLVDRYVSEVGAAHD